jgi:polysaccharide biosynthesis/export protein
MRVTRSLMMFLAVALTVAGCASYPAALMPTGRPIVLRQAAPAPAQVAVTPATPGIDAMVYGSVAPHAPTVVAAQAAPPPGGGRGLLMSTTIAAGPIAAPAAVAPAPPRYVPVRAPPPALAYAPAAHEQPYTLDSGDRLRVVVFGQDGLSNSYVVDASGHIAMPLIGTVLARGATTDELSSRIADKLRDGFVKEPHVAVEIEAYRPFFILGEVTQPGQYPYVADMTVETAIAIAGGFGPRAFRDTVTITRAIKGAQVRISVPVSYPVRPGDTINVQERWF